MMRLPFAHIAVIVFTSTSCSRVDCYNPTVYVDARNMDKRIIVADFYPAGDGFLHRSRRVVSGTGLQPPFSGDTVAYEQFGKNLNLSVQEDVMFSFPLARREFRFSKLIFSRETAQHCFSCGEAELCYNASSAVLNGVRTSPTIVSGPSAGFLLE